jgi:hypothetical protein
MCERTQSTQDPKHITLLLIKYRGRTLPLIRNDEMKGCNSAVDWVSGMGKAHTTIVQLSKHAAHL